MRPVEHKVGLWVRSGEAEIITADDYRQEFIGRCRRGARRLSRPVPPAPQVLLIRRVGSDQLYRVGTSARGALALLQDVAKAAGCVDDSALPWVVEEYWRQSRIHSYAPLYHPDDLHAVRARPLGRYCFQAGQREEVQSAVEEFVRQYGCLVQDFAVWRWYSSVNQELPQLSVQPPRDKPGCEDILWPGKWYTWSARILQLAQTLRLRPSVPAPIAFYVWAACMLTALRRHPEWGGCRAFFGKRLSNLRLVSTSRLDVPFGTTVTETPGPVRVLLFGELLDYLAFAALRGPRRRALAEGREIGCANCYLPFWSDDGRRRYCDTCNDPGTRDAARSRRYRDRLKASEQIPSPAARPV